MQDEECKKEKHHALAANVEDLDEHFKLDKIAYGFQWSLQKGKDQEGVENSLQPWEVSFLIKI